MAELLRDQRGEMWQKRVSVVCDILIVFCSISELGSLPVEAIRAISSNIHKVLILIYCKLYVSFLLFTISNFIPFSLLEDIL